MPPIIALPEPVRTEPSYTLPPVAVVLRGAADIIAALPHARVSPVELHLALRKAADADYHAAQKALAAFTAYVDATIGGGWACGWVGARSRDEVAAELLRAAAEQAETPSGVNA